jgi:hypothetical protein
MSELGVLPNHLEERAPESLEAAERQAIGVLGVELNAHLSLTENAFNLIGKVVSSLPQLTIAEVSQSRKVATALLVRLSNDLRSAALLACRGYALQALSLVASMYETAFAIAAIGTDDALADQWITHEDPIRSWKSVYELTRDGLAKLGVPNIDTQAAVEYRVYRQLCMAKHVNPLVQAQHGHQLQAQTVVVANGPDLSEPAIRAAWFALEHAAGLSFIALSSLITSHMPSEHVSELMKNNEAIGANRKDLEARAKARWGTDDPFPGRW